MRLRSRAMHHVKVNLTATYASISTALVDLIVINTIALRTEEKDSQCLVGT